MPLSRPPAVLDLPLNSDAFLDVSSHKHALVVGARAPTIEQDPFFGAVAKFSGNTDCEIQLPPVADLGIVGTSFTVCAWVRVDASAPDTGDKGILGRKISISTRDRNSITLHLLLRNMKPYMGFYYDDIEAPVLEKGRWYHLAFTYDSSTKKRAIFVNGEQVKEGIASFEFTATDPLYVGSSMLNGYFHGNIFNLRIYNNALSALQVVDDLQDCPLSPLMINPNLDRTADLVSLNNDAHVFTNQDFGQVYSLPARDDTVTVHGTYFDTGADLSKSNAFRLSLWVKPQLNDSVKTVNIAGSFADSNTFWGLTLGEQTGVFWKTATDTHFASADTSMLIPNYLDTWVNVVFEVNSPDGFAMFINGCLVTREADPSALSLMNLFSPDLTLGNDARITSALSAGGIALGNAPMQIAGMQLEYLPAISSAEPLRTQLIERLYNWQGASVLSKSFTQNNYARQLVDMPLDTGHSADRIDNRAWFQPDGLIEGDIQLQLDDVFGKALTFAGSGARLRIAPLAVNAEPELKSFTAECWVHPEHLNGLATLISAGAATGAYWSVSLSDTQLCVEWSSSATATGEHHLANSPLLSQEWSHLALVYQEQAGGTAQLRLFINAEPVLTHTFTSVTEFPWHENTVLLGDCTAVSQQASEAFVGRLANLRINTSAEHTSLESISERLKNDVNGTVSTTLFPLEFSLENEQEQSVLYLGDAAKKLNLRIKNTGERNIHLLAQANGEAHLELHFRPGTLANAEQVVLAPDSIANGWQLSYRQDTDASDVFSFELNLAGEPADASGTLIAGESLNLTLNNIIVASAGGSRATQVQLRYRLHYNDNSLLEGSRQHYMAILQMSESAINRQLNELTDQQIPQLANGLQGLGNDIESFRTDLAERASKEDHDSLAERVTALEVDEDKLATLIAHLDSFSETEVTAITTVANDLKKLSEATGSSVNAYVDGCASIINDGKTDNELELCIENSAADPIALDSVNAKFEVTVYFAESYATGTIAQWALSEDKPQAEWVSGAEGWNLVMEDTSVISSEVQKCVFRLTPKSATTNLPPDTRLKLNLTNLRCTRPGTGFIRVRYEGVSKPGNSSGDASCFGSIILPIVRSSVRSVTQRGTMTTVMSGKTTLVNQPELSFTNSTFVYDSVVPKNASIGLTAAGDLLLEAEKISINASSDSSDTGKVNINRLHLTGNADGGGNDLTNVNQLSANSMTAAHGVTYSDNPGNLVPKGAIMMWSGAVGNIPNGWALCDGSKGTPNLIDKFILGAGRTTAVNTVGGNETITIDKANLPIHNHDLTDPGHSHAFKEHNTIGYELTSTDEDDDSMPIYSPRHGNTWNLELQNSTTGLTVNYGGGQESPEAINILPPYYALCFIMKL